MDVAILSTSDIIGGAAKASYRLHKGLQLLRHNSIILSREKKSSDESVLAVQSTKAPFSEKVVDLIQTRLIDHNRTKLSDTRFSMPYPGVDISGLSLIHASDIVNLHWISHFQSVESISKLLELDAPVVWTLHDMWPFTGGCHYSAGCEGYVSDCYDCPQLRDNRHQIPLHVLKNKLRNIKKNLTVVCPSQWMASCAARSSLFKHLRIEVIPYSLDIDIFKPTPKEEAKNRLGIEPETILLLFGAPSTMVRRKGLEELVNALRLCLKHAPFYELARLLKIKLLLFGHSPDSFQALAPLSVVSTGFISEEVRLAEIYSAADIFLLPSLEDNLPNTMLEAMACATPVAAFGAGGVPDIIIDGKNGVLSTPGDVKNFAEKILALTLQEAKRKGMSERCRAVMEDAHGLEVQAERYVALFKELLETKNLSSKQPNSRSHPSENDVCPKGTYDAIDPYFVNIYRWLAAIRLFSGIIKSILTSIRLPATGRLTRFFSLFQKGHDTASLKNYPPK